MLESTKKGENKKRSGKASSCRRAAGGAVSGASWEKCHLTPFASTVSFLKKFISRVSQQEQTLTGSLGLRTSQKNNKFSR